MWTGGNAGNVGDGVVFGGTSSVGDEVDGGHGRGGSDSAGGYGDAMIPVDVLMVVVEVASIVVLVFMVVMVLPVVLVVVVMGRVDNEDIIRNDQNGSK